MEDSLNEGIAWDRWSNGEFMIPCIAYNGVPG